MPLQTWKIGCASLIALATAGCGSNEPPPHLRIEGGDAEIGKQLVRDYGCGACHTIQGVPGAIGIVGPPLREFAQRSVLAGAFPNVPRHLVPWLMDPPAMQPGTAMPNLGITAEEARHIATFLYTQGASDADTFEARRTAADYPWLDEAASRMVSDRKRLTEVTRTGPQTARIPVERAMELLPDIAEPSR